jgi:hypothetical protein
MNPKQLPNYLLFLLTLFLTSCGKTKLPEVDVYAPSDIGENSAKVSGFIFEEGRGDLISRGVCYATHSNPTLADQSVEDLGAFSDKSYEVSMTDLTAGSTYFVSAYATNKHGTGYSETEYEFIAKHTLGGPGPAGGIICYLNGQSGMEVAPSDQSGGCAWGCEGLNMSTSSAIGQGEINAANILTDCADLNCAARICDNFSLAGYDDWFLPSQEELALIYTNVYLTEKSDFGSFTLYWSSTESDSDQAWRHLFISNDQLAYYKSNDVPKVRAVRSF